MRGFASAQQHWDRAWTDPCAQFQCQIVDAVGAIIGGGDLFGALFGPAVAAGAADAGAAIPSVVLPDVVATAAAPAAAGAVDAGTAAALGAGAAGAAGAGLAGGAAGAAAPADAGGDLSAGGDTGVGIAAPGAIAPPTPTAPSITFGPTGATPSGAVVPASPVTVSPPVTAPSGTMQTGFFGGGAGAPPVAPPGAGAAGTGAGIETTPGTVIGSATGTAAPTALGAPTGSVIAPTGAADAGPLSGQVLGPGEVDAASMGVDQSGGVVSAAGPGGVVGAGAGGGAAGETAQPGGFLSSLLGPKTMANLKDIGTVLSPIAAVGGLGYNLLNALKPLPGQPGTASIPGTAAASTGAAGTAANQAGLSIGAAGTGQIGQGQTLEGYLASGTLPPGIQSAIKSAAEASKASIRANYASKGMSGSSAEAQDLASADERAQQAGTNTALQLFQEGATLVGAGTSELGSQANIALNVGGMDLSTEQLAAQIYQNITNTAIQQDTALGNSISNFATALAGGTKPGTVTVNVPTGSTTTQAAA